MIGPKTNFGLPSDSLNILSGSMKFFRCFSVFFPLSLFLALLDSNNSRICNLDIGFRVLNFEGLPMVFFNLIYFLS